MSLIVSLFLFGLSVAITPGPNNLMLLSSGLNFGLKRSLPHVLGIWLGNFSILFVAGLGLGVLFKDYPVMHLILKIAGSIFLLYLAWKIGSAPPKSLSTEKHKPITLFQACLFQWINPKAWIFNIGAVAVFSKGDNIFIQIIIIGMVLFLTMIIATFTWLLGGYYLQKILKTPKQQKSFNILMGVILALTIISIII